MNDNLNELMRRKIAWYHGKLTRHAAEVLLMNNAEEGSYLLRGVSEGEYCVSARGRSDVKHFKVVRSGSDLYDLLDF